MQRCLADNVALLAASPASGHRAASELACAAFLEWARGALARAPALLDGTAADSVGSALAAALAHSNPRVAATAIELLGLVAAAGGGSVLLCADAPVRAALSARLAATASPPSVAHARVLALAAVARTRGGEAAGSLLAPRAEALLAAGARRGRDGRAALRALAALLSAEPGPSRSALRATVRLAAESASSPARAMPLASLTLALAEHAAAAASSQGRNGSRTRVQQSALRALAAIRACALPACVWASLRPIGRALPAQGPPLFGCHGATEPSEPVAEALDVLRGLARSRQLGCLVSVPLRQRTSQHTCGCAVACARACAAAGVRIGRAGGAMPADAARAADVLGALAPAFALRCCEALAGPVHATLVQLLMPSPDSPGSPGGSPAGCARATVHALLALGRLYAAVPHIARARPGEAARARQRCEELRASAEAGGPGGGARAASAARALGVAIGAASDEARWAGGVPRARRCALWALANGRSLPSRACAEGGARRRDNRRAGEGAGEAGADGAAGSDARVGLLELERFFGAEAHPLYSLDECS